MESLSSASRSSGTPDGRCTTTTVQGPRTDCANGPLSIARSERGEKETRTMIGAQRGLIQQQSGDPSNRWLRTPDVVPSSSRRPHFAQKRSRLEKTRLQNICRNAFGFTASRIFAQNASCQLHHRALNAVFSGFAAVFVIRACRGNTWSS